MRSLRQAIQADPFRKPRWRFDRVKELVEGDGTSPRMATPLDDRYIRTARTFFLRRKKADSSYALKKLMCEDPGLYYAFELYEKGIEDPSLNFIIEARLLAGQPSADIARASATLPEVVDWYERLFFNITDRMENTDYIVRAVIIPAYSRSVVPYASDSMSLLAKDTKVMVTRIREQRSVNVVDIWLDASLKLFAYFGGLYVLEPMINNCHFDIKPVSVAHAEDWLDDYWDRAAKRRGAQAFARFGIDRRNIGNLITLNAELQMRKQMSGGGTDPEAEAEISKYINKLGDAFIQRRAPQPLQHPDLQAAVAAGVEPRPHMLGKDAKGMMNVLTEFPKPTRKTVKVPDPV